MRLIKKSIGFWPRSHDDIERAREAKGHSFMLASYLLFSLFHMHVRAMAHGYRMSYVAAESYVVIDYTLQASQSS